MIGIGDAVLVALITGGLTTIGQALNFKYRLNGTADTIKRIEVKLDESCKILERHNVEIAEIKVNCAAVQAAKRRR